MTLHVLRSYGRAAAAVACAVTMFGCPDKPEETASGTGGGSETDGASVTSATGSGPTSEPTTSGGPGGTQGGTEGMTSTTSQTSATTAMTSATSGPDATSTGGGPGGSSTGGGVPPEVDGACMAACGKIFECVDPPPFPDVEVCKVNCAEGVEGEACVAASVQFNTCLGMMSCPEIIDAVMNENLGACMDLLDDLMLACQGCAGTGSAGPGGCSIGQECPNQPPVEYVCEGNTCTCTVDGMPTGMTCPANGVCAQGQAALSMAANECCGFML